MGEIADMMLEGDLCAGCGVALEGDGDGFPRYCSAECSPHGCQVDSIEPRHYTPAQREARKRRRKNARRNKALRKEAENNLRNQTLTVLGGALASFSLSDRLETDKPFQEFILEALEKAGLKIIKVENASDSK